MLEVPEPEYAPTLNGWCVSFARQYSGIEIYGDAWQWAPFITSALPSVGAVAVLRESPNWHLALTTAVDWNARRFDVVEQNYLGRGVVSTRSISFDYLLLEGFVRR